MSNFYAERQPNQRWLPSLLNLGNHTHPVYPFPASESLGLSHTSFFASYAMCGLEDINIGMPFHNFEVSTPYQTFPSPAPLEVEAPLRYTLPQKQHLVAEAWSSPPRDALPLECAQDTTSYCSNRRMSLDGTTSIEDDVSHRSKSSSLSTSPLRRRFRYETILDAPTAMTNPSDDCQVTYLNRGQTYTIHVSDLATKVTDAAVRSRYRTSVRVKIDDASYRANLARYREKWHKYRGRALAAVEYKGTAYCDNPQNYKKHGSSIQIEKCAFDGFTLTWHSSASSACLSHCFISLRLDSFCDEFSLPTDSIGVPMRLYVKTEINHNMGSSQSEMSFAKIRVFNDRGGAERRTSMDIKQTQDKMTVLEEKIAKIERSENTAVNANPGGTVSMGATSWRKHPPARTLNFEANQSCIDNDLRAKLDELQNILFSVKSETAMSYEAEQEDDPDIFPLSSGDDVVVKALEHSQETLTHCQDNKSPISMEAIVIDGSPQSASGSVHSQCDPSDFPIKKTSRTVKGDEIIQKYDRGVPSEKPLKRIPLSHKAIPRPQKVLTNLTRRKARKRVRESRSVLSFYVKDKQSSTDYCHAIYLNRRTVKDLMDSICGKFGLAPEKVTRVIRVNKKGVRIFFDEDEIRQILEGQEIIVEMSKLNCSIGEKSTSFNGNAFEMRMNF